MASVGDGSVTVEVTGTGGLDAVMFTRVAPGNAQPIEGSTRSGDGTLTTSDLKNRVPHEVVVQLKSGSNFGPASRVLLLTPRATGTSDYDAIRLEIRSQMLQVTNIGQIHLRRRLTRFWENIFKRHKQDGRLNTWEITRTAVGQDLNSAQGAAGTEPFFHDTHEILIRGFMAVKDEKDTETTFQQVVDDIRLRIQLNNRLNGAVLLPKQLQVPTIDHETFGGVLCHFVEMTYEAVVRVGG